MQVSADIKMTPPYLRFEVRGVEDRNASIAAGRIVLKDVDFVLIYPAGSKDVIEKEAESWIEQSFKSAKDGRLPLEWAEAYQKLYDRFKATKEIPEQGFAILNWPVVTPSQRAQLLTVNILTVEQLAGVPDGSLDLIGMGGIALRQRAREFLAAEDQGKVGMESEKLKVRLAQLESDLGTLQEANSQLKAQVAALSPKAA